MLPAITNKKYFRVTNPKTQSVFFRISNISRLSFIVKQNPKSFPRYFGGIKMYEKFDKLLKEKDVTPYRVHKETGISTATLSDWKNGKSQPKKDKIEKICNYFNVPLSYFYDKEEQGVSNLTKKDERDISKTVNDLMQKLESNDGAPLFFDGAEMNEETKILFEQQLKSLVTTVKEINKIKFNPNKNKK